MFGVEEIGVVGVDLEGDEAHAGKTGGFDDGHVVGGAEGWTGDIASGAPAHIGHALLGAAADGLHEALPVEFPDEVEGVAAADGHAGGVINGLDGVVAAVYAGKLDTEFGEGLLHFGLVDIVGGCQASVRQADAGIGNKEDVFDIVAAAEVGNHLFAPA